MILVFGSPQSSDSTYRGSIVSTATPGSTASGAEAPPCAAAELPCSAPKATPGSALTGTIAPRSPPLVAPRLPWILPAACCACGRPCHWYPDVPPQWQLRP
eukprot:33250-Chlamydomonas_euryale.AAC.10